MRGYSRLRGPGVRGGKAPGAGTRNGTGGTGTSVLALRPLKLLSPYSALITPNPGGTLPVSLLFPALFCFGREGV